MDFNFHTVLRNYLVFVLVGCIKGNDRVANGANCCRAGKGSNGAITNQRVVSVVSMVTKNYVRYGLAIKVYGNSTPILEQHVNLSFMFDCVSGGHFYVYYSVLGEDLIYAKGERLAGERNG